MSLGSRIAKRGRAAVIASLASTPREPLLFLYPQWARNSSSASPAAASVRVESHSTLPADHSTPIFISSRPADLTEDSKSLEHRFNLRKVLASKKTPPKTSSKKTTSPRKKARQFDTENRSKDPVERTVRKIISIAEATEDAEDHHRTVRQAYQSFKREQFRSWLPDWRVILSDLLKNTPQHGTWLEKVLEIVIPSSAAERLLYGLDDYMWDIGYRYGCSVSLGPRSEETGEYRSFLVSGSATAISQTAAEVLRIAPDAEIKATPNLLPYVSSLESGSHDLGENTIQETNLGVVSNIMVESAPQTLQRPDTWTPFSFLDYVRTLTTYDVSNHFRRFALGEKKMTNHQTVVLEILRGLFRDPTCKSAISRTACHEAMSYFVRTNQIKDIRVLFVHMEMMGLQMTPDTFNIMLRSAARSEDLHNFHFVLHLMLKRGFTPNGMTWAAFMMAHPDIRVKLHVLSFMKQKGLLNHLPTLKAVCEQIVTPEIEHSLNLGQSQEEFVTHMDSDYSEVWLTVDSGNRILASLGARGLISRCWEFLHFMISRSCTPDNYSINTILHRCKQTTNLIGAVEILRSIPHGTSFKPDEESYRILFEIAWRTRSYNVAKIVWRYACLSAQTSFRMRQLVYFSMKNAATDRTQIPDTPSERFSKFAGPVILGHGKHPFSIEVEFERQVRAMVKMTDWSKDKEKRVRNRTSPISLMLHRKVDLNLGHGALQYSTEARPINDNNLTRKQKKKIWWPKNFKLDESRFGIRWIRRKRQHEQTQRLRQNHVGRINWSKVMRQRWWKQNWYWANRQALRNWRKKQKENIERIAQSRTALKRAYWKDYEKRRVQRLASQNYEFVGPLTLRDTRALQRNAVLSLFRPIRVVEPAHRLIVPRYVDSGKARMQYKSPLLHKFLEQDLKIFNRWEPVKPFKEMLVEAWEKDSEWRRDGQYKEEDMNWLVKNAISIKVRKKGNDLFDDIEWH
jgi:pentatricopeptide repeat protein